MALDKSLITEHFVRSSGPGGQNVNKVSTAVELRFDLSRSGLSDEVKARAAKLAGHKLTVDGVVVIHAHEHRTQLKNREAARERLEDLIARASRAPRSRRATKPGAVAKEKRLKSKHVRAATKRRRGRPADDD